MRTLPLGLWVGATALFSAGLVFGARPVSASTWAVMLGADSAASAQAKGLPTAPASVTASCSSTLGDAQIDLTWSSSPTASGYLVWQSYNGAAYELEGSVTSPTWSTSPGLAAGTYQFEVQATIGANWVSAASSSTSNMVEDILPFCL